MVALSDRIVTAPEASLAPDLEAGDTVLYKAKGEAAPATVVGVDASMWWVVDSLSGQDPLLFISAASLVWRIWFVHVANRLHLFTPHVCASKWCVCLCRPPSYAVLMENGAQMTASHTQLTVLQHVSTTQTSRRQSLDEPASQQASAATQGTASQPSNDFLAPLPPPAFPTNQHSNAGEIQVTSGVNGRSDVSQALLFNTAGLEHNLAAAQRGDAVDLPEAGDLDAAEADSVSPQLSSMPTRHVSSFVASGAEAAILPVITVGCLQ